MEIFTKLYMAYKENWGYVLLKIGLTDQVINAQSRSMNVNFFHSIYCLLPLNFKVYHSPIYMTGQSVYYRNKHNKY